MRIDDLDPPRVVPGAADDILATLEACGLASDERVVYQGARTEAYHAAVHALRQHGHVYACACSRREIADSGIAGIEGYVYPGTCREGLPAGRAARAWRVRTGGASVAFDDLLQGRIESDLAQDIGDFVLYRADHVYAYQLAVAIDDAEAGITDVVRGADLLDSTARQIHLQRLLGFPTPRYAHLPVAVNARGEKLSKQTHAPPVDRSHAAAAVVNALGFLGQAPPAALARAPLREVWDWALASWSLARVPRTRASYVLSTGEP